MFLELLTALPPEPAPPVDTFMGISTDTSTWPRLFNVGLALAFLALFMFSWGKLHKIYPRAVNRKMPAHTIFYFVIVLGIIKSYNYNLPVDWVTYVTMGSLFYLVCTYVAKFKDDHVQGSKGVFRQYLDKRRAK